MKTYYFAVGNMAPNNSRSVRQAVWDRKISHYLYRGITLSGVREKSNIYQTSMQSGQWFKTRRFFKCFSYKNLYKTMFP